MMGLILLAVIGYLLYIFFIKGMIWGILILIFGIFGGKLLILSVFSHSSATIMTFMNYDISCATFFATIITVLGLAYFAKGD